MCDIKHRNIIVIFFTLLYGIIVNEIYRPYIIESNLNHNFISNAGNNLIFIPGSYALIMLTRRRANFSLKIDVLLSFLFLASIEILSAFFPVLGTFDKDDIIALFISGIVTILIFRRDEIKK